MLKDIEKQIHKTHKLRDDLLDIIKLKNPSWCVNTFDPYYVDYARIIDNKQKPIVVIRSQKGKYGETDRTYFIGTYYTKTGEYTECMPSHTDQLALLYFVIKNANRIDLRQKDIKKFQNAIDKLKNMTLEDF